MKQAETLWIVIVAFGASLQLYGQAVKGNCNAIAVGNNVRIEVKCGPNGLTKDEAQHLADQYVELTKKINKGNITARLVLSKLSELEAKLDEQAASPPSQTCLEGSVCTQGPNSGGNTVNNNYHASVPGPVVNIVGQVRGNITIPAPNSDIYREKNLPVPPGRNLIAEQMIVSVAMPFYHPAFQVVCERSCQLLGVKPYDGALSLGPQPPSPAPNIHTIIISEPLLLDPTSKLVFTVAATDGKEMAFPEIVTQVY